MCGQHCHPVEDRPGVCSYRKPSGTGGQPSRRTNTEPCAENILLHALEMDRETGVFYSHEEGRELEEEEMWDMSKRVRIDGLVSLYASLERCPDLWYLLHSRDNYIFSSPNELSTGLN